MAYSLCKIKNVSGSSATLHGKDFTNNELYTIPDFYRVDWAMSDEVMSAITAGNFEVHDGTGIIGGLLSTKAAQIAYLQGY